MTDNAQNQLEEKMMVELKNNQPYEALQYVQSFLARKKKALGQSCTSECVFHGAKLLSDNNAHGLAGTLLTWFIEDGAGVEYKFLLQKEKLTAQKYCDIDRLNKFLAQIDTKKAGPIVDVIFNPLHVLIAKSRVSKNSELSKRIVILEKYFADICEANKKWVYAYKSFIRLRNMKKTAEVLDAWSQEGNVTEKALFFARGLLQLLSEAKISLATELLGNLRSKITDDLEIPDGSDISPTLAIWHLAVMMTELAGLPPMQRVDKPKLTGLLITRYTPLLLKVDMRLLELTLTAAERSLGYITPQQAAPQQPNPMAMLQGLLGGGGRGGGGGGGDMSQMMNMMEAMKGKM